MKNIKDSPHPFDEASQLAEKEQPKTDTGEVEELLRFDKFFAIDLERDIGDIKRMMKFVRKDSRFGRMSNKWEYEGDKERGLLKYSDEQVEARE